MCGYSIYNLSSLLKMSMAKADEEFESCLLLDAIHVSEATRGKGVGTDLIYTITNNFEMILGGFKAQSEKLIWDHLDCFL